MRIVSALLHAFLVVMERPWKVIAVFFENERESAVSRDIKRLKLKDLLAFVLCMNEFSWSASMSGHAAV